MTKKIVFISHLADRTGAPIVLLHLLRWLKQHGTFKFIVLLEQGGELEPDFHSIAETYVWSLPSTTDIWQSRWQRLTRKKAGHRQKIIKNIVEFHPDIVYANTIASALLGIELKSLIHCPLVCHVHELSVVINEYFPSKKFTEVSKDINFFIAASAAVAKNLHDSHAIDKGTIHIVHEFVPELNSKDFGISRHKIRQELNIGDNDIVVVGAGAIDWRKGPDLFIQIAQQVDLSGGLPVHFVWLGGRLDSRDGHKIEHDVKNAGVGNYVHFVGAKSNPYDYLNVADIFILTSREDPYPLVCLEAASLGKPILCFENSGGMPEFVEQDCGMIVPYLRTDAMVNAVLTLRDSTEMRETMGDNAARKLRQRHTIDIAAQQISELLDRFSSDK